MFSSLRSSNKEELLYRSFKDSKHLYFLCSANTEENHLVCPYLVLCSERHWTFKTMYWEIFFSPSKSVYYFSFFFSSTSFSRRKMCWTSQRSGHRSTHMLTLCGLGVSQHSWLSVILTMPRSCWAEEVRDYGFSWGAATPACRFPMPASKFTGKAGFHREVFLHKSSKGMERYLSFMLCPGYFMHRAPRLTWLQIHCWKIRLPQVFLENLTT